MYARKWGKHWKQKTAKAYIIRNIAVFSVTEYKENFVLEEILKREAELLYLMQVSSSKCSLASYYFKNVWCTEYSIVL
jgi:hypothetical protein